MSKLTTQITLKKPWTNKGQEYKKGKKLTVSLYKAAQLVQAKVATCDEKLPPLADLKREHFTGVRSEAMHDYLSEQNSINNNHKKQ